LLSREEELYPTMADVFVSYASEDRERVRLIVDLLQNAGHSVWWDRDIALGTSFELEIEQALDSSLCVVVVWSENSVRSEWVRTEANEAKERDILVPVQIDSTRPPLAYRGVQTADLSSWVGDPNEPQLRSLLSTIKRIVAEASDEQSAPALKPAMEYVGHSDQDNRPSIAILPFSSLSRDDEHEYLADGMTDEIITLLSADPNLKIAERNSAFSYKGQYRDARLVASELGVNYVVEGSIRIASQNVRVTVQLADAVAGSQLWAQRFSRPFEEIYDVQDDIVDAIVTTLGGEVYRAESAKIRQRSP
jgi:TolB-like protein